MMVIVYIIFTVDASLFFINNAFLYFVLLLQNSASIWLCAITNKEKYQLNFTKYFFAEDEK